MFVRHCNRTTIIGYKTIEAAIVGGMIRPARVVPIHKSDAPRVEPKSFTGPMTQNLIQRWENMRQLGVYKKGRLVRQGHADFVRWTKEQIRQEELAEFLAIDVHPLMPARNSRQFVPSTHSLKPKLKAGRHAKPRSHPPYDHQVRAEVRNRMSYRLLTRSMWRAAWVEHCRREPMTFDAFKRMRLAAAANTTI